MKKYKVLNDIFKKEKLIYTSSKYGKVYESFKYHYNITYPNLFTICCSIGFKNNRREKIDARDKEMRLSYFKDKMKTSLMVILMGDQNLEFAEENTLTESTVLAANTLQEYAEGGMSYLFENGVFKNRYFKDGIETSELEGEPLMSLMKFILEDKSEIPF